MKRSVSIPIAVLILAGGYLLLYGCDAGPEPSADPETQEQAFATQRLSLFVRYYRLGIEDQAVVEVMERVPRHDCP